MPLKISVVTAVLNRVDTIGAALASVHAQDWADTEHIAIDGVSTDGTLEILQKQRHRLAVLISERDRGVYDALNKGLKHCTGGVIGFLHADDIYAAPDVLSRVARFFDDPAVDGVYGDLEYLSRTGDRVVRRWRAGSFSPKRLTRGWMPPHPTFFARRQLYERTGGFDTQYRIAADYELLLRFLRGGNARVAYLPSVIVRMRLGGLSNRSLKSIVRKSSEDYRAMRAHGVGGFATLCWKNLSKIGQFF